MTFVYGIPKDYELVVVADFFSNQIVGGAEATLAAILEKCPYKYFQINAQNVTRDLIEKNKDKYWLIGNCATLSQECIVTLVADKVRYSKIECDYFYCRYRSSHLHKISTGQDCDCHQTKYGKFVYGFYKNAEHVFFMSSGQVNEYKRLFPTMNGWQQNKLLVQGSTFSDESLNLLEKLYNDTKSITDPVEKFKKDNFWAVLSGGTWIKNQSETQLYCDRNNIKYELIGGLPPHEFLQKLSGFKGLVFHPAGFDTAPRLVIEAVCLGLKLDLNENVQFKDDEWLQKSPLDLLQYLKSQKNFIWNVIKI